jgi:hypothetical protein
MRESMKHEQSLQYRVWQHVEQRILPHYNFEIWKDSLWLGRRDDTSALRELWGFVSDPLIVQDVQAEWRISADGWSPALALYMGWPVRNLFVQIRVVLVKNQIHELRLYETMVRAPQFGEPIDLIAEFEHDLWRASAPLRRRGA